MGYIWETLKLGIFTLDSQSVTLDSQAALALDSWFESKGIMNNSSSATILKYLEMGNIVESGTFVC